MQSYTEQPPLLPKKLNPPKKVHYDESPQQSYNIDMKD